MHAIELDAEVTNNHEIHLKLPDFVYSQAVKVIVLYDQETPKPAPAGKRQFGQFRDEIVIADDFDEPLPESFWLGVCRTCPRFISASGAHIECLGFFAGVFAFSWRSDIELRAILGLTQATIPRQPPIRRNGGHASA